MKKNLSLLAVLLMASACVSLASCGTPKESANSSATSSSALDSNPTSTPSSAESELTSSSSTNTGTATDEDFVFDQDITITFYSTMSSTTLVPVLDPYIEEFEAMYPHIKIDHQQPGDYNAVREKVATEIGTKDGGPNLAYCYPDHVALYNTSRKVQTLDKFINSTAKDENGNPVGLSAEQIADFVPGYWNEGKAFGDNLMYSLPYSKSTEVLYYNKTEFDRIGLAVPTHWFKGEAGLSDETSMEYACEKLLAEHPECVPLGYDSEANWFITMCEQYNSPYTSTAKDNHFLFDNDVNRGFVEKFAGWYKKNYFTTQSILSAYTSTLFVNTDSSKKTSYMSIGSSAGATHQAPDAGIFEVGIAPIPQVDPAHPKVISQGPNICMFKKSNPKEVAASWLFLKYLTTTVDLQAEFSMASGYVPVIESVMENEIYLEHIEGANGNDANGVAALSAKVCTEQVDSYFTSPAFVGSSAARDAVGELMSAVFTESKTIDQAFKDAIQECNAAV